jgi:hypothetical protein
MISSDILQLEGMLAKPTSIAGHSLNEKDVKSVQDLYEDPYVSRCCPAAKDNFDKD